MILLKTKLTLGSRKYFLPESHLLPMTACCTRRFRRYSTMCSRDYVPSLLQFTSIDKSLWITTYTYRSYCHPQLLLLLQDVLKYSSIFREFLRLLPWVPCCMNTPTDNYSCLPSIRSSPVVLVFHKSLQNNIRSSENPLEPLALEILACLHYG